MDVQRVGCGRRNILKVAYREMVIYCASCMCLSIRIT